jgi:hypothetical protein
MFVTRFIQTGKGNCHALPFLYKILADEIGAKAYLSLAQNHMYIKSRSEKTGWFNTELTNGMFPVDAWVATSGYVTLEAMQSGIYMDTLGAKQSIAFCLYDLAKGSEKRYGFKEFPFIFDCLNLALEYYPNFITALIYKAECLKKRFDQQPPKIPNENEKDLTNILFKDISDEDLELLKKLRYDDILKISNSSDLFTIVESNRRLMERLSTEERAIKKLTRWLVSFTIALAQ